MSDWDWADYRQNRQIRELQDDLSYVNASLASARSSTKKLHSELSKVTGSLEQRINRLSAAFDAFVEISDLRVTLGLFDEQARLRHRARELFGGRQAPAAVSDVDGYWLAPALTALQATGDNGALALARQRDARRATVFHVLASFVLGQAELVSADLLAETFPEIGATVPTYQRAVWTLAADGYFGPAGRALVLRRGVEFVDGIDGQERDAAVSAWQKAVTPEPGDAVLPSVFGNTAELTAALDACDRLAVLRRWIADGLAAETDGPVGEFEPLVKSTLELIVDEGSPDERPLLTRERELRKVIETTGATDAGPDGWESPAGEALALLREDVTDEKRPGRRAVTIRICATHILAAADGLAEKARKPVANEAALRTSRGTVTISPDGPVGDSLDVALARATADFAVEPQRKRIAYGAAAFGLALLVLAIVGGWGWAVPAIGAFGVTAAQLVLDAKERRIAEENRELAYAKLRSDVDGRVGQFAEILAELDRRRSRLDEDLKALRTMLA